jgi:hypothetical protein
VIKCYNKEKIGQNFRTFTPLCGTYVVLIIALVGGEQIKKSITYEWMCGIQFYPNLFQDLHSIEFSDISSIGGHCEIWITGLTVWQSGWSLCHSIGDGLPQTSWVPLNGWHLLQQINTTCQDKFDRKFWQLRPAVNKPRALVVAKTLLVQFTQIYNSIHD